MKKWSFLFSLLFASAHWVMAQESVDTTAILTQKDTTSMLLTSTLPDSEEFKDFLVEKAWEYYPENRSYDLEIERAKKQKSLTNWEFLENFYASGNLNEYTLLPEDERPPNVLFPRYNIGVTLSLGSVFTQTKKSKIEQKNIELAENEKDLRKVVLRAEVLRKYQEFKTAREILRVQTQALEDSYSSHVLIEAAFKAEKITFEDYLGSFNNLNNKKVNKVMAERAYEVSKIDIAEITGHNIEELVAEFKK